MWLKQSTATSFLVGPVLDASGLPVTTAGTSDFRISKAGATAIFSGGTATHDTNGNYLVTLTTDNTDTIGSLEIGMHNTSYAMSVHRFMVIEPSIFDDLVSTATNASGGLRDVARINGQTVSAAGAVSLPAGTIASTTNITQATGITVQTNNDKTDYTISSAGIASFWSALTTGFTTVGSIGKLFVDTLDATISSRSTYGGGDTNGTTILLNRLTSDRATKLDNLDVAISSRLASSAIPSNFSSLSIDGSGRILLQPSQPGVVIPNVTLVDTTTTNTDMITVTSIRSAIGLASANLDTQLSTINSYIDTEISSIKAKTDQMVFTTTGRLDTTAVAVLDKTGYTLSQAFPTNFSSLNIDTSGRVLLQPTQTGVTIPTVTSITNPVSAGSIAANAITSDVLASSAILEIQSGLSTLTSVDIRNAVGLASASLDTQLGNIYADTTNLKTRLPAALINNRIDATIGNIQSDVITNTALATSAVDEIVDAVWNEPYNLHTTAGTFGKLMDILRKANTLIEGTVTAATTPTTTTFSSTVNYLTGALEHSVLMWVSGSLTEQNSPILTYVNANGQITVEEPFTSAPQIGDQFVIAPLSHIHAVSDIQNGLALESTSQSILSGVTTLTSRITAGVASMFQDLIQMIQGTGTALAKWTATALSLAPAGTGGGGGNVTVNANILPIQSYMRKRVEAETMALYYAENTDVFISVEDENGPVDLTSKTLEFVIETKNKTNLLVISDNNIGKSTTGATVRITTTVTNNIGTYLWALRDLTGSSDTVLSQGYAEVSYAPKG